VSWIPRPYDTLISCPACGTGIGVFDGPGVAVHDSCACGSVTYWPNGSVWRFGVYMDEETMGEVRVCSGIPGTSTHPVGVTIRVHRVRKMGGGMLVTDMTSFLSSHGAGSPDGDAIVSRMMDAAAVRRVMGS